MNPRAIRIFFALLAFLGILGSERVIRVYVPPSYERERERRFPVLYVQDGQNAFSTAGPQAAFGWGSWMLDKSVDELSAAGRMREIIMVGIDCGAARTEEYRGPAGEGKNTQFEKYARFLMEELKPKIDREYRTQSDAAHTAVLGSSMGGICSLALAWEHPGCFGQAASFSGWYRIADGYFLKNVLLPYADKPKPLRLYLDSGIKDHLGSDDCAAETAEVAAVLRRIGWRDGEDLSFFVERETLSEAKMSDLKLSAEKKIEARRSQHNELYWRLRAWRALTFLFPSK